MTNLVYRQAHSEDAEAIAKLHTLSWQTSLRGILPDAFLDQQVPNIHKNRWLEVLAGRPADYQGKDDFLCLAEEHGELIGFVYCRKPEEPSWGTLLDNMHVQPELKGRGLGRQLAQRGARWSLEEAGSKSMHLWVFEANKTAVNAYLRWGGERVERELEEVAGNIHAWVYRFYWEDVTHNLLA
ncbi:GNAT family N-acetyltransferase [Pokkaliibacter sp. MBI-7]|uniref:GNAT family N-acetyltransferase n=1 Tax=Pokkaliibacter sp. MBI-7 TaxID=3040600 RepID=UPI00244831A6|nr:GNAT family N-acetyltransferase [Pokkaliibacter sp. MBI-7]MDH2432357.1 GNAT family N-acetyltransferase [Pokkaliibacter sp. MBI-7]